MTTATPTKTSVIDCDRCGISKELSDVDNFRLHSCEALVRKRHNLHTWYFCPDCSEHLGNMIEHEKKNY
jgi:hypothetical protein